MSVDNIWDNSDADYDGNNPNNWSLGWVPKAGEIAVYDSNATDDNCTFSGAMTCDGMRFDNAYAGTVNGNTSNITTGTGGLEGTGGGSATLSLGSGTWETSGDWDAEDLLLVNEDTAKLKMTGAGTFLRVTIAGGKNNNDYYDVEITGTVTLDNHYEGLKVTNSIVVSGTFTLTPVFTATGIYLNGTLSGAGTINGAGNVILTGGDTAITFSGTWGQTGSPANTWTAWGATFTIPANTYTGSWKFKNLYAAVTWQPDAGTFTFPDAFEIESGHANGATWDNDNDPDFVFQGNVARTETAGTITYTKGAGLITISGSNDVELDFDAETTEEIEIDKTAGNVKIMANVSPDYFHAKADAVGTYTLDVNGKQVTCGGNLYIDGGANGAQFETLGASHDMQNGLFVVGNDGAAEGLLGGDAATQLEIDSLDFDIANSSTLAATYCNIQDSACTSEIGDATDPSNVDGTGNTDWDFGAIPSVATFHTQPAYRRPARPVPVPY